MTSGRVNEIGVIQGSHSPEDAISIGQNVLKVTIKNAPDSATNALVGVNEHASNKNLLQPGESVTYHDERVYLDDNSYYVDFESLPATGGKVLVSIILDSKKEVCN